MSMPSILQPRFKNNDAIIQFLKHHQEISRSSVFQGTLYELTVMRELREKLHMNELHKVGGPDDRGVDIRGEWPLDLIFQKTNKVVSLDEVPVRRKLHGITLKPLRRKMGQNCSRLDHPLRTLIQCRAFRNSKISPKEFRELVGTFASIVPNSRKNGNIIMMCSPNLLTKNGLNLINSVKIPLIYLRIEMLKRLGNTYDIEHSGRLMNYYENDYAAALLQGCGIREWLKLSLYDC